MKSVRTASALILPVVLFLFSCHKGQRLPIITTSAVYETFPKTAKGGGVLYSEGNSGVTEKGLCWSLRTDPTINNFKVIAGTGDGSFWVEMTGLEPSKKYYVRAFATNSFGTSYGKQTSFQTVTATPLPSLATFGPYSIGTNSFTFAGTIGTTNSKGLINVGICWNTSPEPTIEHNKTSGAFSTLSFTNPITGLNSNTAYYVRAYTTNNSGVAYGNEIKILTHAETFTDVEGNTYNTRVIGSQTWMVENLKVTKYRDGSPINSITNNQAWITSASGAWCVYDNNALNDLIYGKLYNWQAVKDPRQLAPTGWHIPSDSEWQVLKNNLDGDNVAGQKLRSFELWFTGGNNQSGFGALPGGGRGNTGVFDGLTFSAGFWSSTASNLNQSWAYGLLFNSAKIYHLSNDNVCGYSVRCIKD